MDAFDYSDLVLEHKLSLESIQSYLNDLDIINTASSAIVGKDIVPDLVAEFTSYDMSVESNDVQTYKSKLDGMENNILEIINKKIKKISWLTSKLRDYNIDELKRLLNEIENGNLVPNNGIDETKAKNFNKMLGVFYATGYDLTNGCSGLIKFIEGILELSKTNSTYFKGIDKMRTNLETFTKEAEVKATGGFLNIKTHLRGLSSVKNTKLNITDYRMSIINKWVSSNVVITAVSYHNKTGIKVGNLTYNVNNQSAIGLSNNKDTIKLLKLGIANESILEKTYKNININIKTGLRSRMKGLIESSNARNRFLIAKYNERVIDSLFNLYDDLAHIDNLIIKYIKLTYTNKK